MQTVDQLSVFQKTYDFYGLLHQRVRTFPKGDRYTLGERALGTTLDILESIISAGNAKQEWKIPAIDKALVKLEIEKVLVRLAHEIGSMDEGQYLRLSERLQEIGRMLGGWRRSI